MSKIICDVCGSSYSDTEANCPICGTAKSEEAKPVVETEQQEQTPKAGRYSRTNSGRQSGRNKNSSAQEAPSNLAMIIIVAVLLLAIVVAAVFVLVRLLPDSDDTPSTDASTSTGNIEPPANIPCTGIELVNDANKNLVFTELTAVTLEIKASPENTTDDVVVSCTSDNKDVATAITQADGTVLVTPVANGTAKITITYGDCTPIEVNVTCNIPVKLTLKENCNDVTLDGNNASYDLSTFFTNTGLEAAKFTVEADETVVRVDGTKIYPVANATAGVNVTIRYEGAEDAVTILVRVKNVKIVNYYLSTDDTTFHLSDNYPNDFVLKLYDKDGNLVTEGLTWTPSEDCKACCTYEVTSEGVHITAVKNTQSVSGKYVVMKVTVGEGDAQETLSCKIRIFDD